jgi:hypothetical protein
MKKDVDWSEMIGREIRIYRNLTNGLMSLQKYIPGVGWRLAGHCNSATIKNVRFVVHEKSRQRVIREKKKNVHAYGIGTLLGNNGSEIHANIPLFYDPYTTPNFVDRDSHRVIEKARFLVIINNLVFVSSDALCTGRVPESSSQLELFELFKLQQALNLVAA